MAYHVCLAVGLGRLKEPIILGQFHTAIIVLTAAPIYRTSILPDESTTVEMLDRMEKFHKEFLIEHSDATKQDS